RPAVDSARPRPGGTRRQPPSAPRPPGSPWPCAIEVGSTQPFVSTNGSNSRSSHGRIALFESIKRLSGRKPQLAPRGLICEEKSVTFLHETHFSLEQARAALGEVRPLVEELVALKRTLDARGLRHPQARLLRRHGTER